MNLKSIKRSEVEVHENFSLSKLTTFRLGGPSPLVFICETPHQLKRVIKSLKEAGSSFILIGGGSNLLVSDQGVACPVVCYKADTLQVKRNGYELDVAACMQLDLLAEYAAKEGLKGLNFTTGIPGTVGGAIVGNAGAFGEDISKSVISVALIDKNGETSEVSREDIAFSYRHSPLKESGDIVVSAKFRMMEDDPKVLLEEREKILAERRSKHPDLKSIPSAGSFFKNVEPTSKAERRQAAGWFLEQAGAKTLHCGGAAVFPKHANIIIKQDNCRSQDVYELSCLMAKAVKEKFGLDLIREVRLVGSFKGAAPSLVNIIW